MSGFYLRKKHKLCSTQCAGTLARELPCESMRTSGDGLGNDAMVLEVVIHLIDPLPVFAVCAQNRRILLDQSGIFLKVCWSDGGASHL